MADVLVRSPFYFPVSPTDYKKVLENYDPLKDLGQSAHIDQIQINSPYKTSINGVNFLFNASSRLVPLDETGKFNYTINVSQVQASIEKIVTDDLIEQNVGGAILHAFLRGTCTGLNVQSANSSLKVTGSLDVYSENGRLKMEAKSFEIQGVSDWSISTQNCVGPSGYQAVLEKAILDLMKNNDSLKNLLRQGLDSALAKMSDKLNAQILNVMSTKLMDGVNLVLTPSGVDLVGSTGWLVIQGEVVTKISSSQSGDVVVPAVMDASDSNFVASSGLLLSQEYLQTVIKNLHQEGMIKYAFSGKGIPSFMSFLSNRFFQWFLWSDLAHFAKDTDFHFLAKSGSQPVVTLSTIERGAVFYNIKDTMNVNMDAPQGGGYIPYMNFQSNVDVNSWMAVSGGKMFVGLYEPKMDLKAAWDPSYTAKNKPAKNFNAKFFAKQIASSVKGAQKSLPLPELNLNTVTMKAQSFSASKKWLHLIYQPTTP
jgi:hypothetical protein